MQRLILLFKRYFLFSELIWLGLALWISIASLSSVTFLMDRLDQSFEKNSHELIGADLLVRGDQPLDPEIAKMASELGLRTASTIIFPTMVRFQNQSKLVSLKAVSEEYPLRGQLTLQKVSNGLATQEVWIDEQLAKQLQVAIGDRLELGEGTFTISNIIIRELDRGAAFMNFSPRVMIHKNDLLATGLLGLGSRASYRLLVAGKNATNFQKDQQQVEKFQEWVNQYIQAKSLRGIKVEDLENGQPVARKTIQQAKKMMSLAALFTAMIAAVGIALATHRYAQKNALNVAIWRCFGASRQQILLSQAKPLLTIGVIATMLGIITGYLIHQVLLLWIGSLVSQEILQPTWLPVVWSALVALTLLVGFSGPSLFQLTTISPITALRQSETKNSRWYFVSVVISLVTYGVLLVGISKNLYLSIMVLGSFLVGTGVVSVIAWFFAKILGSWIVQRDRLPLGFKFVGQRMIGGTRFTVIQITALSIAMLSLLLLTVIRTDVLSTWQSSIAPDAPNRFVLNIAPDQKIQVAELLEKSAVPANWDLYPMVRGRLIKVNGKIITSEEFKEDNAKRLIDREFNLSYTQTIPFKNTIVSGKWWGKSEDHPEVSMESGIMKTLGLQLGDSITFDILGTPLDVTITSVRKLDWNSMRVNFFAILPTKLLVDSPQTWIIAYHQPLGSRVDDGIVEKFPNVSIINVEQTIGQINQMIGQLFYAIQALFIFALCAGLIVLFITVLGVQSKRLREAAILKTYGADQNFMNRIWIFEFSIVGFLAGFLSGNISGISGWILVQYFLETDMAYPFWLIGLAIVLGILSSLTSGLYLKNKINHLSTVKILQSY